MQTLIPTTFVFSPAGNNNRTVIRIRRFGVCFIIIIRGPEPSTLASWCTLWPPWMLIRIKFGVLENVAA